MTGSDVGGTGPSSPQSIGDGVTSGDSDSDLEQLGGVDPLGFNEIVDLESRYEIIEELGHGGMGVVFKAKDRRLGRTVAIKRMLGELAQSRQASRRFLTEAQSVAALNHFNIVGIHEMERSVEGPYIVMEYVPGGSLGDRLQGGPLDLSEAVDVIAQVCDGLQKAHDAGIVHRDIKPDNILMTLDGTPKLGDFGLARHETSHDGKTAAGAVLGTLDFMAPEQRRDASQADARSDQWSLAATLYQVLTGESPRVIDLEEVPDQIRGVLQTALKSNPERRFESVAEFRGALREVVVAGASGVAVGVPVEGQCSACGQVNDVQRRHCGGCGEPLSLPCLACDGSMGSWEQFCGHCGASVTEQLEAKEREITGVLERIESLRRETRHGDALSESAELSNCGHPLLAKQVEQLTRVRTALSEELVALAAERDDSVALARKLLDRGEFEGASEVLVKTPDPMRDVAWMQLEGEIQKQRTTMEQQLHAVIEEAAQFQHLIRSAVEELQNEQGPVDERLPYYADAIRSAEELAARGEPELAEHAEWARQQIDNLRAGLESWRHSEEAVRQQEDDRIRQEFQRAVELVRLGQNTTDFTRLIVDDRLEQWTAAAERGLPEAQWLVGDCFLESVGVGYDAQQAVSWLSRAARAGLANAQVSLSGCSRYGIGTVKDPAAALDWAQRAVDQDDPRGWHTLGRLRLRGIGTDRSDEGAVECFQRATDLDWLPAKAFLSNCLRDGRGISADTARAAALLQEAAEQGHNGAQFRLGEAYLDPHCALSPNPGVQDSEQAVKWFKRAVDAADNPRAMTRLEELGEISSKRIVTASHGMKLVLVPAGHFIMGTSHEMVLHQREYLDETPEHFVVVTERFLMGRIPVTQRQFQAVTGKNPSKSSKMFGTGNELFPVENVTWFDAIRFCNLLSSAEGLPSYYSVNREVVSIRGGMGYRLPTEAEWEYAARSGTQLLWWFGSVDDTELDDYACCTTTRSRRKRPRDAGTGRPNWFGLHDMCGNVWEWCWDWYEPGYYGRSPAVNPTGPETGEKRVLRGGSWKWDPLNARSAIRYSNRPVEKCEDVGFRVARSCPPESGSDLEEEAPIDLAFEETPGDRHLTPRGW